MFYFIYTLGTIGLALIKSIKPRKTNPKENKLLDRNIMEEKINLFVKTLNSKTVNVIISLHTPIREIADKLGKETFPKDAKFILINGKILSLSKKLSHYPGIGNNSTIQVMDP